MADRDRLRDEIERRLAGVASKLPTSSLGRIGRAAIAGLRGGRLAWQSRGKNERPLDVDSLATLVTSVGQLKGIAMKAGQMLSYLDLPLSPEMRSALSVLQTHAPSMAFDDVAATVRAELGDGAGHLLACMEKEPAAAASIGQVHRATLSDGARVAVKIQYRDVEKAIQADFRSAAVGKNFVALLVPGMDVDGVVEQARRAVLEECDYTREASFQKRFAAIYAGHSTLTVPAVHDAYSSRRVLTTSWADGMRFDAFMGSNPSSAQRDRFGEALFEFYLGTLFRHGLYNWDPHPGNYVFQRDGRLAILDYGSTRDMDLALVRKLAALSRAVQADTREALQPALVSLGWPGEGDGDFEAVRALVRLLYGPTLRDEALAIQPGEAMPAREIMESKRQFVRLRFPPEMLFTFRIRFGLLSVLARLGARANWYRLERQFADDALK